MEGKLRNHSSPSATLPVPKRTKGRQKIEMKRIEKKDSLNVTFSKRHNGLFKKAESFCNLFNTEMAILVLSTAGRLHNWGYPSLKSVMDRYIRTTDVRTREVQEEGREELPRNPNRYELQNSFMGSRSSSVEVVDGNAQVLVAEETSPPRPCTQDFLAGFL